MTWRLTWPFVIHRVLPLGIVLVLMLLLTTKIASAQEAGTGSTAEYHTLGALGGRVPVWMAAQLHLFFAAFILGVPMFSVLIEFIGILKKDDHYDQLAREFAKLLVTATGITALFSAILLLLLVSLYPSFMNYISSIFSPAFAFYGLLFFAESLTMYVYWYSWDRMKTGRRKSFHASMGIMLNVWGTIILLVTDSWATFMMSPSGVDATGALSAEAGGFWAAMQPPL